MTSSEEDDTIPVAQTQPALDLTVLFNGFKPFFEALSPDDINKLSYEIVQVFQGEGGTLESLLGSTASLTQTLADRDQVIGDLLDNLTYVLDHVADRDQQLGRLIVSFQDLVTRPQGRPRGDPLLARRHLGPRGRDRRPHRRHPRAVRPRHPPGPAAPRGARPQQGRDRPRAPGDADQDQQVRPHRHLRIVVQLLPVPLQGQGPDRRRRLVQPAYTTGADRCTLP